MLVDLYIGLPVTGAPLQLTAGVQTPLVVLLTQTGRKKQLNHQFLRT